MQRPDSLKYQLLELIGISGEFPAVQLNRLISSPSYAEKVITELKKDKLQQLHLLIYEILTDDKNSPF